MPDTQQATATWQPTDFQSDGSQQKTAPKPSAKGAAWQPTEFQPEKPIAPVAPPNLVKAAQGGATWNNLGPAGRAAGLAPKPPTPSTLDTIKTYSGVGELAPKLGSAVAGVGKGLYNATEPNAIIHPLDDPRSIVRQALDPLGEQQKLADSTTGMESAGHKLASYIPFIGPAAASGGEKIGTGDVMGGLIDSGAAILGAKGMGGEAADAASDLRNGIRTARDPYTGKLTPRVREGLQVGGAAAGGVLGSILGHGEGAFGGGYAGYRLAPALADLILPKANISEMPFNKVSTKMPKSGASVTSQLGENASTEDGVAVIPEPRPLFPGETPNYMASVPRPELEDLAKSGKPGAGTQLQQLGKTILYKPGGVFGESKLGERGITRFDDEGNPISGKNESAAPQKLGSNFSSRGREELASKTSSSVEQAQALRVESQRLEDAIRNKQGNPEEIAQAQRRLDQNRQMLEDMGNQ